MPSESGQETSSQPIDATKLATNVLDRWTNIKPSGATNRLMHAIADHGPGISLRPITTTQELRNKAAGNYLIIIGPPIQKVDKPSRWRPPVPIQVAMPQHTTIEDKLALTTVGSPDPGDQSKVFEFRPNFDGTLPDLEVWAISWTQLQQLGLKTVPQLAAEILLSPQEASMGDYQ